MNPLLTPVQLQNIQMRSSYSIFSKALFIIKKNQLLHSQEKKILNILFENSTPHILTQPQIQYWSRIILENQKQITQNNNKIMLAKQHLFFELSLLIGLTSQTKTFHYTLSTPISSPLLKKTFEHTFTTYNVNSTHLEIANTSNEKIPFVQTYKNWFLGSFDFQNERAKKIVDTSEIAKLFSYYEYIPKELQTTIETLIHSIVILEKQSKNQISYSQTQSPSMISIQYTQSILFCDSLIHETMHLEFELIKQVYPLIINNTSDENYYSSVIDKPRPIENCLLALHAFIPLEIYYLNIFKKTQSHLALSRFLSHYFKNQKLCETLENHAKFTQKGDELFQYLMKNHHISKENILKFQKSYKEEIKKYSLEAKNHKDKILKKYPFIMC